jgi:hypothetical protein
VAFATVSLLAGCTTAGGISASRQIASAPSAQPCQGWQTVDSKPGQQWWAEQRWRYHSDDEARAAYVHLAKDTPAWPDWFAPQDTTLAVGTRFEMAIGSGQTPEQPGQFGTFDDIRSKQDVYEYLAVRHAWKPDITAVVTYEVVKTLPVETGPVGPQVDDGTCELLPGRWSQFKMTIGDRMTYLRVVEVRRLP